MHLSDKNDDTSHMAEEETIRDARAIRDEERDCWSDEDIL